MFFFNILNIYFKIDIKFVLYYYLYIIFLNKKMLVINN